MDVRTAYCSACDRNVRVVMAPGVEPEAVRPYDPSELVCLEYGDTCTGDLCPVFKVPTEEMKAKFEKLEEAEGRSAPADPEG